MKYHRLRIFRSRRRGLSVSFSLPPVKQWGLRQPRLLTHRDPVTRLFWHISPCAQELASAHRPKLTDPKMRTNYFTRIKVAISYLSLSIQNDTETLFSTQNLINMKTSKRNNVRREFKLRSKTTFWN